MSPLEAIIREMCCKLVLDGVMEDSRSTRILKKLDVTDKSIQEVTPNLGFGLKIDLIKAANSYGHNFLLEVKKFLPHYVTIY